MSTHHAILGLLALGERCGYDMRRELEALDGEWRLEYGQLYRLLNGLKGRGLVEVRTAPGRSGPERKVYSLTARGRGELETWISEPAAMKQKGGRDELHVKLKVGRALGAESIGSVIEARRGELEELREALVAERRSADDADADADLDRWLVSDTRLRHIEGSLTALAAYEAMLTTPAPSGSPAPESTAPTAILAAGSDDPVLGLLAGYLSREYPGTSLTTQALGSLGGLLALRQKRAHLAGTHLLDVETGEYNVPFVKRLLFEEPVLLVNLTFREQGLLVAAGNPLDIEGVGDLSRRGVRFINRQEGAGTRLLLRYRLEGAGIASDQVDGYDREAPTHDAVASAVALGEADVGMGIRAVAEERGLEFLPLDRERYDLAIPRSSYDSQRLRPLREVLTEGDGFRRRVGSMVGYDFSQMGEIVAEVT